MMSPRMGTGDQAVNIGMPMASTSMTPRYTAGVMRWMKLESAG